MPASRSSAPSEAKLLAGAAVAAIGLAVMPTMIVNAPNERTMGIIQKIFYYHVGTAWLLLLSVIVAGVASVLYLFKGSERGDRVAHVSGELAVLFGLCVLVTGPLWGRVAWGHYWVWDARLTSSLLLWLIMVGYLLARRYGGPAAKRLSAALALFAAIDIPLVYGSVYFWRTQHPTGNVVPTLQGGMKAVFWSSVALFLVVWGVLFAVRLRLEENRAALADLELAIEDSLEA